MKNSKRSAYVLIVLLCAGCGESIKASLVDQIDAGKLVSATEVATTWNDSYRSKIITTKGTFYINTIISVMHGAKVHIDKMDDGNSYLCVEGIQVCKRIIGG